MILGIDEAGRGPWAGPLVVGAVVLGGETIDGLTDSKKLTKKRREVLFLEIQQKAKGVGVGWVSSRELDDIGMAKALRLATKRAIKEVKASFHEIIIDGTVNFLTDTPLEHHVVTMKRADLLVPSVSAASIIAKVSRDRWMTEQDALYPGYGFVSHSGYGTAKHRAAIEELGVTPLHRLSFAPLQKYQPAQRQQEKSADKAGAAMAPQSNKTTRSIGDRSEEVACQELIRRGHKIISRNWKTKYCEIDIVSEKNDTVYFVEVKHRRTTKFGDGFEAITPKKLQQMKFAAKFYAHVEKVKDKDLQLLAIATAQDSPEVVSMVAVEE